MEMKYFLKVPLFLGVIVVFFILGCVNRLVEIWVLQ